MTDTAREDEIARLSAEMEAAYAVWQSDGCFAARDDADRLMRQRDDLVRGRGAAAAGAVEGGGVMSLQDIKPVGYRGRG